ncbi:hypothetical protein [Sagittula salina]|uniref:Uncharacterized protein n=1 Tax=Sagittula salina TaxID=2820268 RepID=A0A940MSK5_9RHOB|nr:hypothetical protein [Sagittula salina]MBP0484267.1 hypothetical protein [Sagittula salina]
MVRDYSAFLPGDTVKRREPTALARLGWGPAFARQIDADALTATPPVRVVAVHRSGLRVNPVAGHSRSMPLPGYNPARLSLPSHGVQAMRRSSKKICARNAAESLFLNVLDEKNLHPYRRVKCC